MKRKKNTSFDNNLRHAIFHPTKWPWDASTNPGSHVVDLGIGYFLSVGSLQFLDGWHQICVQFFMSTQLTSESLVAEPSRLRGAEANLDVLSASADTVDVADHFSATLFYYCVGEKPGVESFATVLTWNGAHQDMFHYCVKPESRHETGIEHGSDDCRFPVHRRVQVNGLNKTYEFNNNKKN